MKRTFALSFTDSAEEVVLLQQAWEALPEDMPRDISKCFLRAFELKAYKIIQNLKDQIDASY